MRLVTTLTLLALCATCTSPTRFVIELTQDDLQKRVERDFPIEERLLVATLRLEDPKILPAINAPRRSVSRW